MYEQKRGPKATTHMDRRRLTVSERRRHWDRVETGEAQGWVCDACGDANEEALVLWETGRVTRHTRRAVVCLCDVCEVRIPHGPFVDQ